MFEGCFLSPPNMTGRRFHRTMAMLPALPWQSKSPSVSTLSKQSTQQGDARGASEVRRGTSSIHFHCPAPIGNEKMRTNFFCTNFLNSPRGPGYPGQIPRTFQIPPFQTQGRQTFEGGQELFGHHPFARKTRTPPSGGRTQKLSFVLFFLA